MTGRKDFEEEFCNNNVIISGKIKENFTFSHESFGDKFYKTKLIIQRVSGMEDTIPIIVSDRIIKIKKAAGKWAEITGEFRSFNTDYKDGKSHLELFVFVREITIYDTERQLALNNYTDNNFIWLDGYLCKKPIYRRTYVTDREITDLIIAVNRRYKKSDYIPCITWGRLAKWAGDLEIGDKVKIEGRIQSREYFKRYSLDYSEGELKTVYEISVKSIEKVPEELPEERLLEY